MNTTEKQRRYEKKVKSEPPDKIDPCGNPECDNKILRYRRINRTMKQIYCSVSCANKCREKKDYIRCFQSKHTIDTERPEHLPCFKRGISNGLIACAKYNDICLERAALGKQWKCTGRVEPESVNTIGSLVGGSFSQSTVRGGWLK